MMGSDLDDSNAPPQPGFSCQQRGAPRRLVVDDPSSDDEPECAAAREGNDEEGAGLSTPFDGLTLPLPAASPAANNSTGGAVNKGVFAGSPSIISAMKKLQAGASRGWIALSELLSRVSE